MRIHGTTQARPLEVFTELELPRLLPARDLPYDLPVYRTAKVHRDHHIEVARALYSVPGALIGRYAAALLDTPLPWTRMRAVYRLLGLVRKWGPHRVDDACRRVLDAEAIDVGLIGRMLERATEHAADELPPAASGTVTTPRFARDADAFAVTRQATR